MEDYIYVCVGGHVPSGKVFRCLDSIIQQQVPSDASWGVVIIWDMPETEIVAPTIEWDEATNLLKTITATPGYEALKGRVTIHMPRSPQGGWRNVLTACQHICCNAASVLLLVDLDDCLVGSKVLTVIHEAFQHYGAEVWVGGGLRTDKRDVVGHSPEAHHPPSVARPTYKPRFSSPRSDRGGNVWSHLRAFRKYSVDRLRSTDFLRSAGEDIRFAWDWALMIPLVEQAWKYAECHTIVYLHEPSTTRSNDGVALRDAEIHEVCQSPPKSKLRPKVAIIGDASLSRDIDPPSSIGVDRAAVADELARKLVEFGCYVLTGGEGGTMGEASKGAKAASAGSQGHPLHSSAEFTVSTAAPLAADCRVLGILSRDSTCTANAYVDIALPTGLGHARNHVVASAADAVFVVGGQSGTMTEACAAWDAGKLIIALPATGGTAAKIGGKPLSNRCRLFKPELKDEVFAAASVDDALTLFHSLFHVYRLNVMGGELLRQLWKA